MNGSPDLTKDDPVEVEDLPNRDSLPLTPDGDPERLAALDLALTDMRERWMRSEAENANIRNRAKRDIEEARQFAIQKFAIDVVEAAENLRRGIDRLPQPLPGEPESLAGVRGGLIETERGFITLLERNGIRRDDPVALPFDPNFHQAISQRDTPEVPAGTILQTLSPAWTLNGRLLRAAMVIISSDANAPAASSS